VSELMMSIDEVLATPGAGKKIVQTKINYCVDCNHSELRPIIEIIMTILE
jgi:hypothetical protein